MAVRGASTITMQLVKNLYLWPGRSYIRKALEIPYAVMVDAILPKHRIMEIYLNIAEWGPGDMGMSYGYDDQHDPPYPPEMENARHVIKKACDDNGLFFLSSWNDSSKPREENVQFHCAAVPTISTASGGALPGSIPFAP